VLLLLLLLFLSISTQFFSLLQVAAAAKSSIGTTETKDATTTITIDEDTSSLYTSYTSSSASASAFGIATMDSTGGGDDAAALRRMTIGELKALLRSRGVNFSDCIEKEDLVNRALESGAAGLGVEEPKNQQTPPAASEFKVSERKETLGGLETIVIENNSHPDTLVVICHGFGANNLDLASIGHEALGVIGKKINLN